MLRALAKATWQTASAADLSVRERGGKPSVEESDVAVQQLEILNSAVHKDLRMRIDPGGGHPHFVMIVISEFPAASTVCPIFLAKDATTGAFYAAALFGFQPGEMLVELTSGGTAAFHPLDLQRQGFYTAEDNIAVDPLHPRFGAGAEIALFEADGTPSNALRKVQRTIGQLAGGVKATESFIQELLGLDLIEPVDISLEFDDGESLSLEGLYTVSRDNMNELGDDQIVALFRRGYLQAALTMANSLNQVSVLARRRNDRLTAKP